MIHCPGINSRIQAERGDATVTRTCVSFSHSPVPSFPRQTFLPVPFSLFLSLSLFFFLFIAHVTRLFIVLYTRASKLRCYRYSFADHSLRLSIFRRFARSNLDKVYFSRARGRRRERREGGGGEGGKGEGEIRIEYISLGGKEEEAFLARLLVSFILFFFFAHPRQNLQFEVRKKRVEGI